MALAPGRRRPADELCLSSTGDDKGHDVKASTRQLRDVY
jgi:hypothetical protein